MSKKASTQFLEKLFSSETDKLLKRDIMNYGKLVSAETELNVREKLHEFYPRIQVEPFKIKLEKLKNDILK